MLCMWFKSSGLWPALSCTRGCWHHCLSYMYCDTAHTLSLLPSPLCSLPLLFSPCLPMPSYLAAQSAAPSGPQGIEPAPRRTAHHPPCPAPFAPGGRTGCQQVVVELPKGIGLPHSLVRIAAHVRHQHWLCHRITCWMAETQLSYAADSAKSTW